MKKNKTFTSLFWSFAEKGLTELIGSIITILLSRLLFPEDYGLISLVQIFITISSIVVENGLGSALIQAKNPSENQISTIFYINFMLGSLFYCILYICAPCIAGLKNIPELTLITRALALKVPIASIYSIQHAYVQKRMEFKKFFYSSLVGTLLGGIVGVSMAYVGFGVWSLVAFNLIDQLMDSITLFITTKWWPKFCIKLKESKIIIQYGINILFSELIGRVYSQIKPLIIALKYTVADLALNAKGNKFGYLPISLISSSVMRVMFPSLTSVQDDDEKLINISSNYLMMMCFLMAPLLLGLAAISNVFVPLVLTDKWNGCVIYIVIYCITYLATPFNLVNEKIIAAKGRADLLIKRNIVVIAIEIVSIFIAISLFDNPVFIPTCLLFVSYLNVLVDVYCCNKVINFTLKKQLSSTISSLLCSLVMSLVVYLLGYIEIAIYLKITVQIIVGIVIYVMLNVAFKTAGFSFVVNFIKGGN